MIELAAVPALSIQAEVVQMELMKVKGQNKGEMKVVEVVLMVQMTALGQIEAGT
jgi:hypothetical protein